MYIPKEENVLTRTGPPSCIKQSKENLVSYGLPWRTPVWMWGFRMQLREDLCPDLQISLGHMFLTVGRFAWGAGQRLNVCLAAEEVLKG